MTEILCPYTRYMWFMVLDAAAWTIDDPALHDEIVRNITICW